MKQVTSSDLLPNLLLSADHSVDLIATTGIGFIKNWVSSGKASLTAEYGGMNLRCLLTVPGSWASSPDTDEKKAFFKDMYEHSIILFLHNDWEIKKVKRSPSFSCVIIDNDKVFLSDLFENSPHKTKGNYFSTNTRIVQSLCNHFNRLWNGDKSVELIYEDLILSSLPKTSSDIILASNELWEEVIQELRKYPDKIFELKPRKFEELIAELLIRQGMSVTLTQQTKDGGYDILANTSTWAGQHLYLVECKHYSPHRPVGVSIVRALYGLVEANAATKGIIVTTSSFTKGAIDFQRTLAHRLSLKGFSEIKKWLVQ